MIGTSPIGTVYKGTLSSGVEIAVASVTVTSLDSWSKTLEVQFRKKVSFYNDQPDYLIIFFLLKYRLL